MRSCGWGGRFYICCDRYHDQITERLAKLFGDKLLVYHSKFSDNERVEVWNKLLHNDEPMLVLGVRSSSSFRLRTWA